MIISSSYDIYTYTQLWKLLPFYFVFVCPTDRSVTFALTIYREKMISIQGPCSSNISAWNILCTCYGRKFHNFQVSLGAILYEHRNEDLQNLSSYLLCFKLIDYKLSKYSVVKNHRMVTYLSYSSVIQLKSASSHGWYYY